MVTVFSDRYRLLGIPPKFRLLACEGTFFTSVSVVFLVATVIRDMYRLLGIPPKFVLLACEGAYLL